MHLCTDNIGNQYLFKPAKQKFANKTESFRAEVQVLASRLQEIISPNTAVKCELTEINGVEGAIQPKIDIDENKTKSLEMYYMNGGDLDENIARQFMREYVVDYLLGNYDSHYRNFIVDDKGNLRGIDKEQSLKYITDIQIQGDLKFDKYHPNMRYGEKPPIYGKIFSDIDSGKISSKVLDEVTESIKKIRKISKNKYKEMFEPYVTSLTTDEEKRKDLYDNILGRYDSLDEVQNMVNTYQHKETLTSLSIKEKKLHVKFNELFKTKERELNNEKRAGEVR